MQILMLAENDPAGTAIQLTQAINQYTQHQCRLITWQYRYVCDFEKDIHLNEFTGKWEEIEHLLKTADVFHFHMVVNEEQQLGPFKVKDYSKGKKIIRHHHGEPRFRENLPYYLELYKKTQETVFVATPDMLDLFPDQSRVIWLPNLIRISQQKYLAKEVYKQEGPLIVSQSPTRKNIKSTDVLERVIKQLQQENLPISLDLLEYQSHLEVLRRKKAADIVFDQMNYSFGISSLESFALGTPAICALGNLQIDRLQQFCGCTQEELPWILASTEEELYQQLKSLLNAGFSSIAALGIKSRKFMEKFWNEQKILNLLLQGYTL